MKKKDKANNSSDLGFGVAVIVSFIILWCIAALIYRICF